MAYQVPAFDTPNRQPTDINPLDAELASDPQAAMLWRSVSADFTTLTGAFGQLSTLANNLFARLAQINSDSRLNEGAKRSDETTARNGAQQATEALKREAEAARTRIKNVVTSELDVSGFIQGENAQATVVMIERTRDAWKRCEMILGSVDVQSAGALFQRALRIAKEAAERGDSFTLSALRQNLEAYLEGQGQKMPHQQIVSQLNVAAAPAATPRMRAAMQIEATLDAGYPNLTACFLTVERYCKDKNAFRVSGLSGWPGQPPVTL